MTSKPVVAVGRFTSPDTMARLLKDGVQDMIGAARPSIADPFIPNKIDAGRIEDIRECIGCNVCYAHDSLGVPIRCTQNPTMGEEWRLGWHPEKVKRAPKTEKVLVVGAGPAGLEATRVLGQMGHNVLLAEAERTLGGRITKEAKLPGLAEWARVRDWRLTQIDKLAAVEVFPQSPMTAESVLELGVSRVLIATGAKWAKDAVGRHSDVGFAHSDPRMIIAGDTILDGAPINASKIVIYDDDHYYFGSVCALELRKRGHAVVLITPAGRVCGWGAYTDEQEASTHALIKAGVEIITNKTIDAIASGRAELSCVFSNTASTISCDAVVPLTRRIPVMDLYDDLISDENGYRKVGIQSVSRIGDAEAPSIIAAAVHSGYRAAIDLGQDIDLAQRYGRREHPATTG